MNITKRLNVSVPLAVIGAAALLSGCAVDSMSEEALGTELLAETATERNGFITAKYQENMALLGSEIPNSTVQFSNGAKRDFTGAGNNSSIYYGDAVNRAHIVLGYIRGKYLAKSAQAGVLGYPTSDEFSTAFGTGRCNFFQSGRILWKNGASQAFETHGNIDIRYAALQQEWGHLGFPTSDEYVTGSNRANAFEFGRIYMTGGVTRPVLTGNNPNNKLVQMNKPRITSATITVAGSGGYGCVTVNGAGFPAGSQVYVDTYDLINITTSATTATVRTDGTFTFTESASCHQDIFTVNGIATVGARVNNNSAIQAVYAVPYNTTGKNYPSLP